MRGQQLKSMVMGVFLLVHGQLLAKGDTPAFTINDTAGKTVEAVTEKDLTTPLYEVDKAKYEKINQLAREQYLTHFWKQECWTVNKKKSCTDAEVQQTMVNYLAKQVTVTELEVTALLNQHKDNPQLKDLSDEEKKTQIRNFLKATQERTVVARLLDKAVETKQLVVHYPAPIEPRYELNLNKDTDHVRYGASPDHIQPKNEKGHCKPGECPLTVYEYSEFQCPFCSRVQPTIKKLLETYEGKVTWVFRDFPLSFHDRATPAAIAAKCAGKEKKFWHMYEKLFANQRNLADSDFLEHAKSLNLNIKNFETCLKSKEVAAQVDAQFKGGQALGVTGTPAFFVNGRRFSGALPYAQFKRVFDEELAIHNAEKAKQSTAAKKKDLNKTPG